MSDHKAKEMTRHEAQQFAEKMKRTAQDALRAAIIEQQVSERLARILMTLVATNGAPIAVPMQMIDDLPDGAKLVEAYSKEQNCIVLQVAVPKAPAPLLVDQDGHALTPESETQIVSP